MKCIRCGDRADVLTLNRRCPRCEIEVRNLIDLDTRRQVRRFAAGKSLDRWGAA